jgi:serine/threonine protein kinase
MAERHSFTAAHIEAVTSRLGLHTEKIIPTRRGSAIVASTGTERSVLKIADLTCAETEQSIVPSRSKGIENEARILRTLRQGIAPALRAYERDETAGLVFSSTEFIDGVSADYRLMQGHDQFLGTVHLLQSIAQLHAEKIVHGDIQPSNVLWLSGDHKKVRLIDFELSKHIDEPAVSKPGLYHFLSPEAAEQVLGSEECIVNIAEETFAAAATVLALLKGTATPLEYSASVVGRKDRLREIAKPTYTEKGVVPDAIQLSKRLIHVLMSSADARPKTPAELLEFLNPCLGEGLE